MSDGMDAFDHSARKQEIDELVRMLSEELDLCFRRLGG